MHALALSAAFALLAAPALAQEPVTAEEFEAMVEGRTLTYGEAGQVPYGIEHYFANRRVAWGWVGTDECLRGEWYPEGPKDSPAICFVYEDDPAPQCWRFFRDGEGLRAVFLGDGDDASGGTVLYELIEEQGGLVCGGVGA